MYKYSILSVWWDQRWLHRMTPISKSNLSCCTWSASAQASRNGRCRYRNPEQPHTLGIGTEGTLTQARTVEWIHISSSHSSLFYLVCVIKWVDPSPPHPHKLINSIITENGVILLNLTGSTHDGQSHLDSSNQTHRRCAFQVVKPNYLPPLLISDWRSVFLSSWIDSGILKYRYGNVSNRPKKKKWSIVTVSSKPLHTELEISHIYFCWCKGLRYHQRCHQ